MTAFASGFGGDEDLGGFTELTLCENAAARCVAVANFHTAMDLGNIQTPFT